MTRQLFTEVDKAELEAYETAGLAGLAADAFESFCSRIPGSPKVVLRDRSLKGEVMVHAPAVIVASLKWRQHPL